MSVPFRRCGAIQARVGDRLLLCSDGVTDYVIDDELAWLLRIEDATVAIRRVVDGALDHSSRDNVTAVVVDIVSVGQSVDGWLVAAPGSGAAG